MYSTLSCCAALLAVGISFPSSAIAANAAGGKEAVGTQARSKSAVRAERVYGLLTFQGVLKAGRIAWEGAEYELFEKGYQICESYGGICFQARAPGAVERIVLVVYEAAPEELVVEKIEYAKYHKTRSQEVAQYFVRCGVSLNDVFKLTDKAGVPLFEGQGALTQSGDAVYEQALRGKGRNWARPGQIAAQESAPWGDPVEAKKKMKKLKAAGFFEISKGEYECLRKFKVTDDDMFLTQVWEGSRLHLFVKDDPTDFLRLLIAHHQKGKECKPGGMTIRRR